MQRLRIIDSHTGGEPTRLVVAGGPELGTGHLTERLERFRQEFDGIRSAVINEPRGSDVLVGALLCRPQSANCVTGVIFFNNTGYLNMCGHGTIGLVVTLAHMGRIGLGQHHIDTPVGVVAAELLDSHRVAIRNVPSFRHRKAVTLTVEGLGPVTGDIAWGGNWFFLVSEHGQPLEIVRHRQLTDVALRIRAALDRDGITGADGGRIDHIELFGRPSGPHADSRNFVLCPGGAFDRSPCGTGTSAKLACLVADGKLAPGDVWRQESIVGSVFEGRVEVPASPAPSPAADGPVITPVITGSAWVTAEAELLLDPSDPFIHGIQC